MNNNAWFKKEKPLLSLQSMSGGAAGSLMQGAASKTYVDDVFSTYLYEGNGSAGKVITNNIDLSTKGGMVWTKQRSGINNSYHYLADTVRGITNYLIPSESSSSADDSNRFTSVSSTGFTIGNEADINTNGDTYASWTFAKQEGFFDVVTYTGNSTGGRTVSHNLGCVPGMIILKNTNSSSDWVVGHRNLDSVNPWQYRLEMDKNSGRSGPDSSPWNYTAPTSTEFTLGNHDRENKNGDTFVAYLFAGGESTAATARSVDFDGTGDYLSFASSSDFEFGTGDFTIECWVKPSTQSNPDGIYQLTSTTGGLSTTYSLTMAHEGSAGQNKWVMGVGTASEVRSAVMPIAAGAWYHVAHVRSSGVSKLYVDGIEVLSASDTNNYSFSNLVIGGYYSTSYLWKGNISNFRIVKGTAVYTSPFKPPTEPLTSITNTKLLCCNNSSTTGSTVTPGTITANGDPTARIDSPFDDPEGFKFGEEGDQNMIKCGSYIGGSSPYEVNFGFEPQWLLVKCGTAAEDWCIFDCMRGIPVGGDDLMLRPNVNNPEAGSLNLFNITPTGIKINSNAGSINEGSHTMVYMAIRRPDGYVGKPAEAGTDVFAMDYGNASATIPAFDSGFPVDYAFFKQPASSGAWYTSARLKQGKQWYMNLEDGQANASGRMFDSNVGWDTATNSGWLSWMWKRGAGFDVQTYTGNGAATARPHNLGVVPEMIWVKTTSNNYNWCVGHIGINGGTNPWTCAEYLIINDDAGETVTNQWGSAPTSTHWSTHTGGLTNDNSVDYIAFLFASVTGISKVGYYSGSNSSQTITTGFQPRMVIIKSTSSSRNWVLLDTTRGWASGSNDSELNMNKSDAAGSLYDFGNPISTGFTVNYFGGSDDVNVSGNEYIYYAHA